MKFVDVLTQCFHPKQIILIEEFCNGRLIETHSSFGFGETESEEEDSEGKITIIDRSNFFYLYGRGDNSSLTTQIEVNQEVIKIENGCVFVEDSDGTIVELRFFEGKMVEIKN